MKHLGLVVLLVACSDADRDTATSDTGVSARVADCTDAEPLTWENFGHGFMLTWCQGCHGSGVSERYGAPEAIVFDTEEDVARLADAVARTALEDASMPPAGGVSEAELDRLASWLDCGLP